MAFKFPNPFNLFSTNDTKTTDNTERRGVSFKKRGLGGFSADLSTIKINFNTFFFVYSKQSDVYACVREWMDGVGESGHKWLNVKSPDEHIPERQEIELESFLNGCTPFGMLTKHVVRDLGICANAFVEIVKNKAGTKPIGMQTIDPRTVAIVADEHGRIIQYIQRINGMDPVTFDPGDIIHIKYGVDPMNELMGYAPMEPIIWEAYTDIEAQKSNYSFFENDAQPSVVYILDDNVAVEDEKDLLADIKSKFTGGKNKHKAAIMSGVKEIKTIGTSHKDMEFLQQRRFSTEKICASYGVPKFMLGYTESVNNNNGVELNKHFITKTIRPIEALIEQTFNRALGNLFEGFKDLVELRFKEQSIDSETELEKRAIEMARNGLMSIKEAKQFLGHDITPEMESQENFDKNIIHSGGGARALDDIGVEPFMEAPEPIE